MEELSDWVGGVKFIDGGIVRVRMWMLCFKIYSCSSVQIRLLSSST